MKLTDFRINSKTRNLFLVNSSFALIGFSSLKSRTGFQLLNSQECGYFKKFSDIIYYI